MSQQADQMVVVSSQETPEAVVPDAALQKKLTRTGIICGGLYQDVIELFGEENVTVVRGEGGICTGFTREWDLEGMDGNFSQASVTCSVHTNGSLKVAFTKNLAEHLITDSSTEPAKDGTPAVLLYLFCEPKAVILNPPLVPAPDPVPNLVVKVKNPPSASTMYGFWKIAESLVPGDPEAVPGHNYAALAGMVRALCSV